MLGFYHSHILHKLTIVPLCSQQGQTCKTLHVLKKEGALFLTLPDAKEQIDSESKIVREKAVKIIVDVYIKKTQTWVKRCRNHLKKVLKSTCYCPNYLMGFDCSKCERKHEVSIMEYVVM